MGPWRYVGSAAIEFVPRDQLTMWKTPDGDRTIQGAEATLIRNLIADLAEMLWVEAEGLVTRAMIGVRPFDELCWPRRLAILDQVAEALFDSSVKPPVRTAIADATLAAIIERLFWRVSCELNYSEKPFRPEVSDPCYWRRLTAAAWNEYAPRELHNLYEKSNNSDAWDIAISELRRRLIYDRNDWNAAAHFMDMPPADCRKARKRCGLGDEYFTSPAPDPRSGDIPGIFDNLRKLTAA